MAHTIPSGASDTKATPCYAWDLCRFLYLPGRQCSCSPSVRENQPSGKRHLSPFRQNFRQPTSHRVKSHFAWRKSATKFPCVKTVSDKVVKHSLTSVRRLVVDWLQLLYLIFARSASALTASERSSVNTTRTFTTCSPMSLRWIIYVDPKPPKGTLKRKVS